MRWRKKKKEKKCAKHIGPKNSASYIGHQLPWFLNIGIGQRKTHIGRPLILCIHYMELHRITSEEYCTFCLLRYFIYKNTNSTVEPSCLNRLELRKLHERQMFDLHMLWYELIPFILIQTWLIHLSTQADGTDTLNQRNSAHGSRISSDKV